METFQIEHARSRPRHPQTNGQIERFNGTIKRILIQQLENDWSRWEEKIPIAEKIYNTQKHRTIGVEYFNIFCLLLILCR